MKITSRGLPPRGAPYFLRPSPSNVPRPSSKGISRGLPRRARLQNHLLDLCEIRMPASTSITAVKAGESPTHSFRRDKHPTHSFRRDKHPTHSFRRDKHPTHSFRRGKQGE